MVAAAALDQLSIEPRRALAVVTATAALFLSIGTLADGYLGLPTGDLNEALGFSATLAGEGGPGRTLLISTDRGDVPGEARSGPGFWYRPIDGSGMTQDEVWLPPPRAGDIELAAVIDRVATGVDLRPGSTLAPFAIDWLVLDGEESYLDGLLQTQLDLVPTPLDPSLRIYENPDARPMAAGTSVVWARQGTGFGGVSANQPIALAVNQDDDWSPDPALDGWSLTVDGGQGSATYRADSSALILPILAMVMLMASVVAILVGRARR